MIIPITKNIACMELSCGRDATHEVLQYVHANKNRARFEATDGQMLSIIECPQLAELKESLLIKFHGIASKITYGGELDTETCKIVPLTKNNAPDCSKPPIMVEIKPADGDNAYPDVERILPTAPIVYRAAFNARYLDALSKSLENDPKTHEVVLEFQEYNRGAIRVRSSDKSRHGIIMPLLSGTYKTGFVGKPVEVEPCPNGQGFEYGRWGVRYIKNSWEAACNGIVGVGVTWREAIANGEKLLKESANDLL